MVISNILTFFLPPKSLNKENLSVTALRGAAAAAGSGAFGWAAVGAWFRAGLVGAGCEARGNARSPVFFFELKRLLQNPFFSG